MHTISSLLRDINNMSIDNSGTLIIHSSYKSIGNVSGRGEAVLEACMEYMHNGLLVLPTHTWDSIGIGKCNCMDVINTPVCIGVLPELFRNTLGVIRSLHPTHSVGAYGRGSIEFVMGEELAKSPCPKNSVWHKLLERRATIALIGVDFTRNTFIHGIEEWNDVPDTLTKEYHDLYVLDKDGTKYYTPQRRHCSALGSETFSKLEGLMLKLGVIRFAAFGDAKVTICDAYKLNHVLSKMLSVDKRLLMDMLPLDNSFYEMEFTL